MNEDTNRLDPPEEPEEKEPTLAEEYDQWNDEE